jgi:Na+-translocating ferredoxin:NAD+ oxidoreductase subunit A
MNQIPFVVLIILSAFSMNLTLQCALGIKGAVESKNPGHFSNFIRLGVIFFSVILLWAFFFKIIHSIISGLYIYILLFPVSYIVYEALEFLLFHQLLKKRPVNEYSISFPGGITAAAVFLCVNIANNFPQAVVLSFGFTAGICLVLIITGEIRRRAALEAVPVFLRGKPLVLISMGMLSMVFSVGALLIFRMMGTK